MTVLFDSTGRNGKIARKAISWVKGIIARPWTIFIGL
jgi:hypothetical protein